MMGPLSSGWHQSRAATQIFLVSIVVLTLFQVIRAISLHSPIFGGDEYAYFAQGVFLPHIDTLYSRDPLIQKVANPLYLKLIWILSRLVNDPSLAIRAVSSFAYVAFVATAAWVVARQYGPQRASALVLLFALLPTSAYAANATPDLMFHCFAGAAGLSAAVAWHKPRTAGLLSGLFVALAFLVKPHAASIFIATAAWGGAMALLALLRRDEASIGAVRITLWFFAGVWLSLMLLSWPLTGRFTLDPRYPIGIFYGNFLTGSAGPGLMRQGLAMALVEPGRFAGYLAANTLSVLLAVFPFLALLALHLARELREQGWTAPALLGALWFALVAAAAIGMTSLFTFYMAKFSAMEADRLHARYYAYIYFIAISLAFLVPRWGQLVAIRTPVLKVPVAIPLVVFWCLLNVAGIAYLARYKIWFQDNTELFSLVGTYSTLFGAQQFPMNWIGLGLFLAAPFALLLPRPASWAALICLVAAWFATGLHATSRIQNIHSTVIQFRIQTGAIMKDLLATVPDHKILVAGNSRYGETAHVLYGAVCLCHVRQTRGSDPIRQSIVPEGVDYIFAVDDVRVELATERVLSTRAGTLHRIIR